MARPSSIAITVTTVLLLGAGAWWWRSSGPVFDAPPAHVPATVGVAEPAEASQIDAYLHQGGAPVIAGEDAHATNSDELGRKRVELPSLDGTYELLLACSGPGSVSFALFERTGSDTTRAVTAPSRVACGKVDSEWVSALWATDGALGPVTAEMSYSESGQVLLGWALQDHNPAVPSGSWADELRTRLPDVPMVQRSFMVNLATDTHAELPIDVPPGTYHLIYACMGKAVVLFGLSQPEDGEFTRQPCDGDIQTRQIQVTADPAPQFLVRRASGSSGWVRLTIVRAAPSAAAS